MKFSLYCNISKRTIENAYRMYDEKYGATDRERVSRLGIDIKEKNELWKLWVLALFYQVISEERSEKAFNKLPEETILFKPQLIAKITLGCNCPPLRNEHTVHFCRFQHSKGLKSCVQNLFYQKCPFPIISYSRGFKHLGKPRILRGLISSAIFLKQHDFDFQEYYNSLADLDLNKRTNTTLDTFMVTSGSEKISHMFLAWLSNPIEYNIWDLDYERFLAIDRNIIRVARNIGLCNTGNVTIIRAHLHKLMDNMKVNPRVLELALLNVGQSYCKEGEKLCSGCPFSTR